MYQSKTKSATRITCPLLKDLSTDIQQAHQTLMDRVRQQYETTLKDLHCRYFNRTIQPLMTVLAVLDVAFAGATVASRYGYTRPKLGKASSATSPTSSATSLSFLDIRALRHPLIERLLANRGSKTGYVPNDVSLSGNRGLLLHGVNSVGKSSLLKSIAIAVLMAQSGMFVPAREMVFLPYTKIFARTGNDDNLHRAQSSFVKEMSETGLIAHHADAYSLVIADELCASTESDSAVNIVATLLQMLSSRQTTFAFATHLFSLQDHPCVRQLLDPQQLGILHNMHLKVDVKEGKLVFHRVLAPGLPSNRTYGVLVADKVIRHPVFTALVNRQYVTHRDPATAPAVSIASTGSTASPASYPPNPLPPSKSKYNARLWLDECAVCHYRPPTKRHIPLDTHHIHEQHTADTTTGLIEHRFHKNERHNLVVLCKTCHQRVDRGELVVEGYVGTCGGEELRWREVGC